MCPRPRLPHAGQHGLGHVGQGKDIRLEHRANLVVLALLDGGEITVAGVIDQDVDLAEALLGLLENRRDLRAPGDVQRCDQRVFAAREFVQGRRIARGHDHLVAAPEQGARQFAAEAR